MSSLKSANDQKMTGPMPKNRKGPRLPRITARDAGMALANR